MRKVVLMFRFNSFLLKEKKSDYLTVLFFKMMEFAKSPPCPPQGGTKPVIFQGDDVQKNGMSPLEGGRGVNQQLFNFLEFIFTINAKRYFQLIFFFFGLLSFFSCGKQSHKNEPEDKGPFHYLHLAHTRLPTSEPNKVDPRVEKIDFNKLDLLMLGGDLTISTTKDVETINYVDSLFDLGNPDVLWAVGNHDKKNLSYVDEVTKRPTNYVCHKNGITFLVLNTQNKIDWKCNFDESQLQLINQVADTISVSSHLIVLTHNLVWLLGHPELRAHTDMNNLFNWTSNKGVWESNWKEKILPRLQDVYWKGINVICLAGDIGNNARTFEFHAADGITYLASGIKPENEDVKILLFRHEPPELFWEFVKLEEFLEGGQEFNFKGHKRPEGK